jgi:hypothetical protein
MQRLLLRWLHEQLIGSGYGRMPRPWERSEQPPCPHPVCGKKGTRGPYAGGDNPVTRYEFRGKTSRYAETDDARCTRGDGLAQRGKKVRRVVADDGNARSPGNTCFDRKARDCNHGLRTRSEL